MLQNVHDFKEIYVCCTNLLEISSLAHLCFLDDIFLIDENDS